MSVAIKRESIKGKFFIIARDKGKILAKKEWSRKFTLEKAKRIFRKNNTFDKDVSSIELRSKPFKEITDRRKKPVAPKNAPFRVVISGMLKDGMVIAASSMSKFWKSINEAKEAAMESFFERLAFELKEIYDADEGIKLSNNIVSIKSEVVYLT